MQTVPNLALHKGCLEFMRSALKGAIVIAKWWQLLHSFIGVGVVVVVLGIWLLLLLALLLLSWFTCGVWSLLCHRAFAVLTFLLQRLMNFI